MQPTGSHFELDLNVKKDNSLAQPRISILKSYADKCISDSLEIANLHLLGVLYFYTGRIEAAIENFKSILIKDPKNINAHANIAFVYHRLFHSKEAKKHEQQRDEILNNADAFTRARVFAEHAYAHAFETYSEVHELLRFHQSNDLLDECLKEKLPTSPDVKLERAAWMMCKIWNFKKLFNRNYLKEQRKEKNEIFYETIMETLIKIQASVPENSPLNSLAWAYFGYFFWKKPVMQCYNYRQRDASSKDIIPSALRDHEMADMFGNPRVCFERAVQINQSVEVLQMYGSWLFSESKYEEAEEILNKAIEIDDSENNYSSKRGEVLLQKVNRSLKQGIGPTEGSVNWKALELAIKDFNLTLRINPSAFIYHKLGKCCFLLSKNGRDEVMTIRALEAYHNGLACQDGQSHCVLHFDYAKCLKALGEDKYAMVSMRRSVENQHAQASFVLDIQLLLQWYIEKWNSDTTQHQEILLEVAYWFNMAFTKYKTEALRKMMVAMVKRNEGFFMDLFAVCSKKTGKKHNQFCLDILKELKGTEDALVKFVSKSIEVDGTSAPLVKSASSMQPRNRKGYKYDFFVVYSNDDSEWMKYSLLNQLESMRGFKGLIGERDFTPGNSILENVSWAISNSNKVVLVITSNYLQSRWCQHQMEQALITSLKECKAGKVIPILKDGAEIPESLRVLVCLNLEKESLMGSDLDRLAQALDN